MPHKPGEGPECWGDRAVDLRPRPAAMGRVPIQLEPDAAGGDTEAGHLGVVAYLRLVELEVGQDGQEFLHSRIYLDADQARLLARLLLEATSSGEAMYQAEQLSRFRRFEEALQLVNDLPGDTPWSQAVKAIEERHTALEEKP